MWNAGLYEAQVGIKIARRNINNLRYADDTCIYHAGCLHSLVAQRVKHLPAMWKTWVWLLGWEDPLEKEMATHSSILAWKIQWTEKPGGLNSMGSQRVGHDWATSLSHRWHYPNGRKWRGPKETLDEGEKGEWKGWLKTQHSKNKDHDIWSYHFTVNRWGKNANSERLFSWAPKSLRMLTVAVKLKKTLAPWKKSNDKLSILKSRGIDLPTKVHIVRLWFF